MSDIYQIGIYLAVFKDAWLGVVGGGVAYLLDYSKAKRSGDHEFTFMYTSMFVNMTLGAFVAHMTGSVLPSDFEYRDAVVGVSGVLAYQILLFIQSDGLEMAKKKLTGDNK